MELIEKLRSDEKIVADSKPADRAGRTLHRNLCASNDLCKAAFPEADDR